MSTTSLNNFEIINEFLQLNPMAEMQKHQQIQITDNSSTPSSLVSPTSPNFEDDFALYFDTDNIPILDNVNIEASTSSAATSPFTASEPSFSPMSVLDHSFSPSANSTLISPVSDSTSMFVTPSVDAMFPALTDFGTTTAVIDPNMAELMANIVATAKLQQQQVLSSATCTVPAEVPKKSKAGRKPKNRPGDSQAVIDELNKKRAKNTEAARRSRIRRLARLEQQEKNLVDAEARLEEYQKKEAEWNRMRSQLEKRLCAMEKVIKSAGLKLP